MAVKYISLCLHFPDIRFFLLSQLHLPRCCVGGPVSLHFLFPLYKPYLICHYQLDFSILPLFLDQIVTLYFFHSFFNISPNFFDVSQTEYCKPSSITDLRCFHSLQQTKNL